MKLNIVPSKTGYSWVIQGIKTFFKMPLPFILVFVLFTVFIAVLGFIPYGVGMLLALMFVPSAYLGFMRATQASEKGHFFSPLILFSSFAKDTKCRNRAIRLGCYYVILLLLLLFLTSFADDGAFAKMYLMGKPPTMDVGQSAPFMHAALIAMFLYIPLCMLLWHAPALIYWEDIAPLKAMFFSFVAIKRNFGAFAVFTVVWMIISSLVMMAVGGLVGLTGSTAALTVVGTVTMVILGATFLTSIYFSFKDCFTR